MSVTAYPTVAEAFEGVSFFAAWLPTRNPAQLTHAEHCGWTVLGYGLSIVQPDLSGGRQLSDSELAAHLATVKSEADLAGLNWLDIVKTVLAILTMIISGLTGGG